MTASNPKKLWQWITIIILFLITMGIRLHHIDEIALRGDEGYTALHWTQSPFTTSWWNMVHREPHPILAFIVYWGWSMLAGNSVFALRVFSVLSSLGGVAGIIALGRRLLPNAYLVYGIALLWSIHPLNLWHAQDARLYGLLSTLNILNFYLLLRAVENSKSQTGKHKWRVWSPYLLLQLFTLYLYFFEGLALIVHGLFVLSLGRRDILKEALKTWAVMFVLAIPLFFNLYDVAVLNAYAPNADVAQPLHYFTKFLGAYLLGENKEISSVAGLLIFSVLFGSLLVSFRYHKMRNSFLLLWIAAPPLVLYFISLQSAYFRPRYAMTSLPAILLAIIVTLYVFSQYLFKRAQRQILFACSLILLLASFFLYQDYQYFEFDEPKAPDWVSLQTYLAARTTENDVVVISDPDPAFEYYYQKPGSIYYLPIEDHEISEDVAYLSANYASIYLLGGSRIGDLEQKFRQDFQLISADEIMMRYSEDRWHVAQYRAWDVAHAEIEQKMDIQFGDIAVLQGYSWLKGDQNNDILLLYWLPLRQTETSYSVLTHIFSANAPDGIPVAVLDHGIANAIITTTNWRTGVLYRDPVAIPVDLEAGDYIIQVGLYETNSLEQVPLIDSDLQGQYKGRYPLPHLTEIYSTTQ